MRQWRPFGCRECPWNRCPAGTGNVRQRKQQGRGSRVSGWFGPDRAIQCCREKITPAVHFGLLPHDDGMFPFTRRVCDAAQTPAERQGKPAASGCDSRLALTSKSRSLVPEPLSDWQQKNDGILSRSHGRQNIDCCQLKIERCHSARDAGVHCLKGRFGRSPVDCRGGITRPGHRPVRILP